MNAWTAEQVEAMAEQLNQEEALADTQRAIIEAAERRGYERGVAEQNAQGEAIPAFWAAASDDGEIAIAYSADDGNSGAAARTECNQWINDHGGVFHLRPLYLHAERARVPDGWVLVPIQPTPFMVGEGAWAYRQVDGTLADVWKAMLAAAPPQPAEGE